MNQLQQDINDAKQAGMNSMANIENWLVINRGYTHGNLIARCARGGGKTHRAYSCFKVVDSKLLIVSAMILCGSRQLFSRQRDFQVWDASKVTCIKCRIKIRC